MKDIPHWFVRYALETRLLVSKLLGLREIVQRNTVKASRGLTLLILLKNVR